MGSTDTALLRLQRVSAGRGAFPVVSDIDLSIEEGEVVALLGANGVGKSTLVDSICNFTKKYSGRVDFAGDNITKLRPARIARMGLSQVSQTRDLFGQMSVRENLVLGRLAAGARDPMPEADIYKLFPVLQERGSQRAASLSGGEQQMLAVARALVSSPRILILDEPTAGLAPVIVDQIGRILNELADRGLTVLLVEQNVEIALHACSRFVVLANGGVVFDGTKDELGELPRARLAEMYL